MPTMYTINQIGILPSRTLLTNAKDYFQTLSDVLLRLERRGERLEPVEMELSGLVEDWRTREEGKEARNGRMRAT